MLLVCSLLVVPSVRVSADQDGDYSYTQVNGQATIIRYSGPGGVVSIPSTLGGYPTVALGENAFYSYASLTSVAIPDSVTSIGDKAFESCTFLSSVSIPNSVITIGAKAFKSCTSLPSVNLGDGVTTIGDEAFYYCVSLGSLDLGSGITTIGNNAFSYCSDLTTILIPDNAISIGSNAFASCSSLTSVTIGDGVKTIGDYAFWLCSSLATVTIGANVTTIGKYAFASCPALTSIIVPNKVTSIGDGVFSSCFGLTSVVLGNNTRSIGKYVFASCSSLTSITFLGLSVPKTVGTDWIKDTPSEIRGHAYANSEFPAPGDIEEYFNGLRMGEVITIENKQPVADFTWTPANLTVNQTIAFDASASHDLDGSLLLYEWDWNSDGIYEDSSATSTMAHSWALAGQYPVTLRVTDDGDATGTKTMTLSITSGSEDEDGTKGTPGFELLVLLAAIGFILMWMRKLKK
jgi:hypothetical protein